MTTKFFADQNVFAPLQGQDLDTPTLRTVVDSSGGAEANNLATGAGFERVLTASDIGAPVTELLVQPDGTPTYEFALRGREVATLAVPYVTPTVADTAVAFDVFPNGNPADFTANTGVAWVDICNNDVETDGPNYECLRLGIFDSGDAHVGFAVGGTGTVRNLRMMLNGGNVGIGVIASPTYKLEVNSDTATAIALQDTGVDRFFLGLATAPSQWFTDAVDGDHCIRGAGGDILIGTNATTPTATVRLTPAGQLLAAGTLRTVAAGSGGLEVNNTATGAGFERVLTVSDLGGGGPITGTDPSLVIRDTDSTGNPVTGKVSFEDSGTTEVAYMGVVSIGNNYLELSSIAGSVVLRDVDVAVVQTSTAAAGGLLVNNQQTGTGLERVLTLSDSPAPTDAKMRNSNATAVTSSTTLVTDSVITGLQQNKSTGGIKVELYLRIASAGGGGIRININSALGFDSGDYILTAYDATGVAFVQSGTGSQALIDNATLTASTVLAIKMEYYAEFSFAANDSWDLQYAQETANASGIQVGQRTTMVIRAVDVV